ncbi:MAG: DUF4153 domain-containing protein [Erysipelotrichaceae bacterium]|nr:DUF4153 domain-containing protein [Erysipelotrichaceae bacterium]
MKIENLINRFVESYRKSVRRFSLTFILSVILALLISFVIIVEDCDDIVGYLMMALASSLLLSVLLTLLQEKYGFSRLISAAVTLAYIIVWTIVLDRFDDNVYVIMAYAGVQGCLLCLVVYEVYQNYVIDNTFGYLVSNGFYTVLLTSVVEAGVCICIAAFTNLIYDFDDSYKAYLIMTNLIYLVIGVNHYLSCVPEEEGKMSMPRAYSLTFNKAGLAIYLVLLAILYVYLFKSIITLNLPKGRINIFASIALLLFCGYYLSVRGEQAEIHQKYLKICGWLMIPIMLIQSVAIYIRVSELGLTAVRCLSLACNVIALLFVIDALFIRKVTWLFAAMAVMCLLVSIGPLNCVNVANRWQQQIMETVLKANDMLKEDGTVIAKPSVSQDQQKRLLSAYDYLYGQPDETLSKRQKYLVSADSEVLYGFAHESGYYPNTVSYSFDRSGDIYDIEGYRSMEKVSYYSSYFDSGSIDAVVCEDFDLTEDIRKFIANYDEASRPETMRFYHADSVLDVSNLYIETDLEGRLQFVRVEGYLFRK